MPNPPVANHARAQTADSTSPQSADAGYERPIYHRSKTPTADGAKAELLSTFLEGVQEGVAHVSVDGEILYANSSFARLFGTDPSKIEEHRSRLRDLMAHECWVELDQGLKIAAQEPVAGSLRIEDPAGQRIREIRIAMTPVVWKNATTIKVNASEMTEVLAKNRELKEKEDSLHALSTRIMQLQDEERRRIARDLHDITGQELAVVIMQLMQVARQQSADSDAMKGITDAAGMVRKIEDEIRTLSYVLHPPLIDELGLGAALNWYVEGFSKRSGIDVKVDIPEGFPRLNREKELALFRVVQEALTNVMRHSGSRTARIQLDFNVETVALSVNDDGKGIGQKRFGPKMPKEHGVGIMGMRERLEQLGGGLEVHPLSKGTEVVATMPIGEAAPVERPLTDDEILRMARALGYKEAVAYQPGEPPAPHANSHPASKRRTSAHAPEPPPQSAPPLPRKRVLIADDHEVTRQGIQGLLKALPNVEVCGEARDGLEAILKARKLNPDLIIMDLTMPGGGGFSAAQRIRKSGTQSRILFFTTHQYPELERMARTSTFEGLVLKAEASRDLVRGVRAVLQGHRFFGGQVLLADGSSEPRPKTGAATA